MARTVICGFEMGTPYESNNNIAGNATIQSTVKRTGSYALQAVATNGEAYYLAGPYKSAGGTSINFYKSARFYLYIALLPNKTARLLGRVNGYAEAPLLAMLTDGKLRIYRYSDGVTVDSTSTLSTGEWHRIEFDNGFSSGYGSRVYVSGTEWASTTGGSVVPTLSEVMVGFGGSGSAVTCEFYYDDILFDDDTFATSGFPGAGKAIILWPTSDNSRGTWTGGAGGTTNLYDALNNVPPAGLASPTNTSQITNVDKTGNQDATFNLQSYTTGGIGSSDTINAVMAIHAHGEQVATGTKAGDIWIASNPTQSAGSGTFDYGNDVGALGNYASNWRTSFGPVTVSPSVTLGTSPTVTVRKTTATSRATDVCFLGIYVDYTLGAAPTAGPSQIVGGTGIVPWVP